MPVWYRELLACELNRYLPALIPQPEGWPKTPQRASGADVAGITTGEVVRLPDAEASERGTSMAASSEGHGPVG
jgi:aminoglycoside phosphotransferase (APT) family kinase protein